MYQKTHATANKIQTTVHRKTVYSVQKKRDIQHVRCSLYFEKKNPIHSTVRNAVYSIKKTQSTVRENMQSTIQNMQSPVRR